MWEIALYTDGGGGVPTGSPGGWAAVLLRSKNPDGTGPLVVEKLSGAEPHTSNNRMEITAAIRGLERLQTRCRVQLYTDSRYLLEGVTLWLPRWKHRGWLTAEKEPVKHRDLWEQLDAAIAFHRVEWHQVRGHAGHTWNEVADSLCTKRIRELKSELVRSATEMESP